MKTQEQMYWEAFAKRARVNEAFGESIMKTENLKQMAAIGHIIQGWSTIKYTNYYFFWEFPEKNHKRQMCFSCAYRAKH